MPLMVLIQVLSLFGASGSESLLSATNYLAVILKITQKCPDKALRNKSLFTKAKQ